ncbi:uncharacterized protein N7484_009611 [Penicillium longicatenatum]|uniref:uncharacterized protein n=1 Tax=Penicillium longicatenatum TaxID=1561947 RepID=UPI0025495823|nr:uncharacterized protein N7484_009611 [Penicillium longicatenatum]KAJ5636298.1 hypothetical protein N7484_009611 [Penicillium longicatenatum]
MNLTTRAQAKSLSKSQSPGEDPRARTPKSQKDNSPRPSSANRKKSSEIADTKAKRTRTGCLTCRERHLKCDEALGRCLNCRKSDRICRRGVRLNFIDIQTVEPPHIITRAHGAKLTFRDDSRIIASEYVGGFERYPPPQPDSPIQERRQIQQEALNLIGSDQLASLFQSVAHSFDPSGFDIPHSATTDFLLGPDTWHDAHLVPGDELLPHGTSHFAQKLAMKHYSSASLTDPEQSFLLQLFVEEVGPWIDSMDSMRHFTQVLPLLAIDEPMLLKALVACGARQAFRMDPSYGAEKVLHHYEAANHDLLYAVQDPNRDSVLCATAALVLGIYEMMSSQPLTKHTSGSRALIRECGWTAKTPSLGGSCFWISVSMEVLHCLNYICPLSWNPDTWGVDMHMEQVQPFWKNDDQWLHRIIYICAKIANFRVSTQHLQSLNDPSQNTQFNDAVQEWNHYNAWCEQWANSIPRSMKPLSNIQPWHAESKSPFPKIWLLKRSAIISQFFYHTACIVLARAHPMASSLHIEMKKMQQAHAYEICGLATNLKARDMPNISIQCLAIAAESLEARDSQEEVLGILDMITKETHWRSESFKDRLKRHWNWSHPQTVDPAQMHNSFYDLDSALPIHGDSEFSRITNPLLDSSDFSIENHPYQGYYVAPHHQILDQYNYGSYLV